MKNLFVSEFQRLWHQKSTLACLLLMPIMLIASAKYYLGVNEGMEITNPQYTSFYNFPVAALQEQLVIAFNIIVVLLVVLSITQEIRDGSIRMVLIRRFTPSQVFIIKFLVLISTILIYLITYLFLAYLFGVFMFPKLDEVGVFYHNGLFSGGELFIYSIKYYLLAFLTLMAVTSIIFFIAILSKSVVIALGISIASILGLIVYPTIIQILLFYNENLLKYQLLSLTQVQFQGIAIMLGEQQLFRNENLITIAIYIVVFMISSYLIFSRKDNLM